MGLAVVRDLTSARDVASPEEVADLETDVLAGFVLARSSAGLADSTIRNDVIHLEQMRAWLKRPLWSMETAEADAYFGRELRSSGTGLRLARAQALSTYFYFVELRHRAQIHALTGLLAACPLDELNRPRGQAGAGIRIPPGEAEAAQLFAGWRAELSTCRKFAPTARTFAAARLTSQVGLRVNELRRLDLADVHWHLGRFGKLHVRYGKGANGSGPKERMVPLINGADRLLQWYIQDVWGLFDDDHTRLGAPLFPSERRFADGSSRRISADGLRQGLARAVAAHLADWTDQLTPHALRHYCASQLYNAGMDLLAVQELLGHRWLATTMRYVHVHRTHVEDAWLAGQQRAVRRIGALLS